MGDGKMATRKDEPAPLGLSVWLGMGKSPLEMKQRKRIGGTLILEDGVLGLKYPLSRRVPYWWAIPLTGLSLTIIILALLLDDKPETTSFFLPGLLGWLLIIWAFNKCAGKKIEEIEITPARSRYDLPPDGRTIGLEMPNGRWAIVASVLPSETLALQEMVMKAFPGRLPQSHLAGLLTGGAQLDPNGTFHLLVDNTTSYTIREIAAEVEIGNRTGWRSTKRCIFVSSNLGPGAQEKLCADIGITPESHVPVSLLSYRLLAAAS